MNASRKHFVTFLSPGTFVAEDTTKPIKAWDPVKAVQMAGEVVERYGARPYGFYFTTCLAADPIPDGEGGTLKVEPKEVSRSGMHFLGGEVFTVDDIKGRGNPKDRVLISNMEGNGWWTVVQNDNSWRSTQPFKEGDVILNPDGSVAVRGDATLWVEYRKRKAAERDAMYAQAR